jgi:hypothetical protein
VHGQRLKFARSVREVICHGCACFLGAAAEAKRSARGIRTRGIALWTLLTLPCDLLAKSGVENAKRNLFVLLPGYWDGATMVSASA